MSKKTENSTKNASRQMRKVTQHRWNEERGRLERYFIFVPVDLREGLKEQTEKRKKIKDKFIKKPVPEPIPIDDEVKDVVKL